jgi:hypothetical protein
MANGSNVGHWELWGLDSIDGLLDIGAAVADQIDLAHFGRFVRA